jgi:hypothetical protein
MRRNILLLIFFISTPLFCDEININSLINYGLIRDKEINAVIYYYPLFVLRREGLTIERLHKNYTKRVEINNIDTKIFILEIENMILQEEEYQGREGDIRCCVDFFIGNDLFFSYAISASKEYMFINGLRIKNNNIFYDFINNYININS